MIPEGNYIGRAIPVSGEWGSSSNKGTPYLQVEFKITEGELSGKTIDHRFYFSEKAREMSVKALRACGCRFPDDDLRNLEGLGSRDVRIEVEHEEHKGKLYPKVKWVNSTAALVDNPLTPRELDRLAREVKGTIVSGRSKSSAGHTQEVEEEDESDVPF